MAEVPFVMEMTGCDSRSSKIGGGRAGRRRLLFFEAGG